MDHLWFMQGDKFLEVLPADGAVVLLVIHVDGTAESLRIPHEKVIEFVGALLEASGSKLKLTR